MGACKELYGEAFEWHEPQASQWMPGGQVVCGVCCKPVDKGRKHRIVEIDGQLPKHMSDIVQYKDNGIEMAVKRYKKVS